MLSIPSNRNQFPVDIIHTNGVVLLFLYRILSLKRPGRLYIFFYFGVGVYWSGALNREGSLLKKLDFLSNSLLSLGAIQ